VSVTVDPEEVPDPPPQAINTAEVERKPPAMSLRLALLLINRVSLDGECIGAPNKADGRLIVKTNCEEIVWFCSSFPHS
jgi:hypothetical protein